MLDNFDDLENILKNIEKFKPKKYKSNTSKFIKIIEKEIDNNK